jgi:hypothetical protein
MKQDKIKKTMSFCCRWNSPSTCFPLLAHPAHSEKKKQDSKRATIEPVLVEGGGERGNAKDRKKAYISLMYTAKN